MRSIYFDSSLRVVDCASPKLIGSRGFHTGDPIKKSQIRKQKLKKKEMKINKLNEQFFVSFFCSSVDQFFLYQHKIEYKTDQKLQVKKLGKI